MSYNTTLKVSIHQGNLDHVYQNTLTLIHIHHYITYYVCGFMVSQRFLVAVYSALVFFHLVSGQDSAHGGTPPKCKRHAHRQMVC
jgi:hypothetical protein